MSMEPAMSEEARRGGLLPDAVDRVTIGARTPPA